jgi:hypothetical protein
LVNLDSGGQMLVVGKESIAGRCYRGKIHFTAGAEPIHLANCHGENCRRAIGMGPFA